MLSNALLESNRVLQGAIYNKDVDMFEKKFSIFKDLKVGEKIGKYKNGEYYTVSTGWFQQGWRWYYNENRANTLNYLDKEFGKFTDLLDKISIANSYGNSKISYSNICLRVVSFIDVITPFLFNLKKTYLDTRILVDKIDSIILELINFKEKIRNSKVKKKKNVLVHSFDDLDLNYLSTIV
jgi:hypothetical protein